MNKLMQFICMGILFVFASCASNNNASEQTQADAPKSVVREPILAPTDPDAMYDYLNTNIVLTPTAIFLKEDSSRINNRDFVRMLYYGKYFPERIKTIQDSPVYKLRSEKMEKPVRSSLSKFALENANRISAELQATPAPIQ